MGEISFCQQPLAHLDIDQQNRKQKETSNLVPVSSSVIHAQQYIWAIFIVWEMDNKSEKLGRDADLAAQGVAEQHIVDLAPHGRIRFAFEGSASYTLSESGYPWGKSKMFGYDTFSPTTGIASVLPLHSVILE